VKRDCPRRGLSLFPFRVPIQRHAGRLDFPPLVAYKGDEKTAMDISRMEVVDDIMGDILRQKSPLERLEIAFGLWRSARHLLVTILRGLHPDWDENTLQREVSRRMSHGAT